MTRHRGQRRGNRRSLAFSLVELTVVVVVTGILASVAVPRYAGFLSQQRVEAAAQRIVTDLALIRRRAMTSGAKQTLKFYPAQDRYVLPALPDPDGPGLTYVVALDAEPYRAAITLVNIGNDTVIEFDAYGVPVRNASGVADSGSIVVQVGNRSMLIYIDADGHTTVTEGDGSGGFDLTPLPINALPGQGTVVQ